MLNKRGQEEDVYYLFEQEKANDKKGLQMRFSSCSLFFKMSCSSCEKA